MAEECVGSILATRIRVARLAADGTTPAGSGTDTLGNMYVSDQIVRMLWDHEVEPGVEIVRKNGSGNLCVNFRDDDRLKGVRVELELCVPDNELTTLLIGGSPLITSGSTTGYAAPSFGTAPNPNGVSIELWTRAIAGDVFPATNPFWCWPFPKVKLRMADSEANSDSALGTKLVGYAYENPNWGNGPANDWPYASAQAWQRARVATMPTAACGAQVTPVQV